MTAVVGIFKSRDDGLVRIHHVRKLLLSKVRPCPCFPNVTGKLGIESLFVDRIP